jgi:pilus assembly protein Flp/PilA
LSAATRKTDAGREKEDLFRRRMMKLIRDLFRNEDGATAIEYGLIAALIAVAAITAMGALGNSLGNTFNLVSNDMNNASDGKL